MSSSPLRNDGSSKTGQEDFFARITITTDNKNEDTISVTTAGSMTCSPKSSSSSSSDNNDTSSSSSSSDSPKRTKEYYYGSFMGSLMHLASDSFDDGSYLDDSLRRHELDREKVLSTSPSTTTITRKKSLWYAQFFSLSGTTIKGSNGAMWLGHVAFILGSLFYLKGAILDLQWTVFTNEHHIPNEIIDMDDDVGWIHWEKTATTTITSSTAAASSTAAPILDKVTRHVIDTMRQSYWTYSTLFDSMGGAFFVLCGLADLMYYGEYVDIFMIFAGVAGVISANCDSSIMQSRWNSLSCHMYLIEAYVLIRRHRKEIENDGHYGETYEGYYIFLFSRICFFGGCIMDVSTLPYLVYICTGMCYFIHLKNHFIPISLFCFCAQIITSYIELSAYESTFLDTYADFTSCILWITCAFVDFGAEIYFYESEEDEDDDDTNDDTNEEEEAERMEKRLLISV